MRELRTGWAETSIEEIVEFNPKHDSSLPLETELSFVPMPAVSEHTGEIISGEPRKAASVLKGYTHFQNGDVLFAKITPCMENGKAAVARSLINGLGCGSTEFHVMRPKGAVEATFLWRFIRQKSFRAEAETVMTGAVGQRRVPTAFLKSYSFFLPPLAEQRRIVTKLDALDASSKRARADLDRIPALVARAKQAILEKALKGELTSIWREAAKNARHSADTFDALKVQRERYHAARRGVRLKDLPPLEKSLFGLKDWIGCCLADVCELRLGYAFKSEWFSDEGVRLLRGANVAPGLVDWNDEKRIPPDRAKGFQEYLLSAGDIVIAMDRPLISSGVKVARITPEDQGSLLVQRVASPVFRENVMTDYAWLLFNSQLFLALIAQASTGSDLPHISGNDILGMQIPLPPLAEQVEIFKRIESAFAKIDRLASEAASASKLLDRLDQALLSKAFRGELVPQDPNDEPASELLARIQSARAAAPKAKRTRRTKETA